MNKAEQFKAVKDGLDVIDDIYRYAKLGFEAISEDDLERFKWYGLFHRKNTPRHFMLRIRIPNGIVTSAQFREIGEIANTFGRGRGDITTRQQIQIRWLRIEDVPEVLERLAAVKVTTRQTGHDNVRNIVGCPVAGLDGNELIDASPLVKQISALIVGNRSFTNLPRKFNVAIAGCREDCGHSQISDIGMTPAVYEKAGDRVIGFNVKVGGSLGSDPRLAWDLDVFVQPAAVPALTQAILEVFRDHGFREKRNHARLKFLIEEWGIDRFRAAVVERAGRSFRRAGRDALEGHRRDHVGIHPQKQPGYSYVGCMVPVGRITGDQMREAARLAEKYGIGELRLTVSQDVIFPFIHATKLPALKEEPFFQTFPFEPDPILRGVVSCTGAEFCHFALIETKSRALEVAHYLQQHLQLAEPLRIHWSGCPNACGQTQIGDIGLQGTKARIGGKTVEAVHIFVGGRLGRDARVGEEIATNVPCSELPEVLLGLIKERFADRIATPGGVARPEVAAPAAPPAATERPAPVCGNERAAPVGEPGAALRALVSTAQ